MRRSFWIGLACLTLLLTACNAALGIREPAVMIWSPDAATQSEDAPVIDAGADASADADR